MSKLTVNVPTTAGTRPAVVRQTLQVALNRSVQAASGDSDRSLALYPTHHPHLSKAPRIPSTTVSATNEFGTRSPRASPGPTAAREPAGTKIVNFGQNVELHPRGRFDVRGVGSDGFFPPVKLRTGTAGVRFSTSAGSVRSVKSPRQQQIPQSSLALSPLNVELAPAKTPKTTTDAEPEPTDRGSFEWLPSARTEIMAKKHKLQDRPANPYNTRATASRETFALKESFISPSDKAFKSGSHLSGAGGTGDSPAQPRPSKDAAWVRAFKVKQRRHNRVREILESKPAGLTVGSPVHMDSYR